MYNKNRKGIVLHIILGVDAGNHDCKVAGPYGVMTGDSTICEWFERDFDEEYGMGDDFEFEIDGRKGFMGTIASYEDQFGGGSFFGDTKANDDTKMRVLLSVHRYIRDHCRGVERVSIVTGQPVKMHKNKEKQKIIDMLVGPHAFMVNGERVQFEIENAAVVAEGSGAYFSESGSRSGKGTYRIIDIGSGTLNCVTVKDGKQNNNASGTFNFGMSTIREGTGISGIARGVTTSATELRWEREDLVLVCGGAANELLPYIKEHFTRARTVTPTLMQGNGLQILDPVYANAVGFYQMANRAFSGA